MTEQKKVAYYIKNPEKNYNVRRMRCTTSGMTFGGMYNPDKRGFISSSNAAFTQSISKHRDTYNRQVFAQCHFTNGKSRICSHLFVVYVGEGVYMRLDLTDNR